MSYVKYTLTIRDLCHSLMFLYLEFSFGNSIDAHLTLNSTLEQIASLLLSFQEKIESLLRQVLQVSLGFSETALQSVLRSTEAMSAVLSECEEMLHVLLSDSVPWPEEASEETEKADDYSLTSSSVSVSGSRKITSILSVAFRKDLILEVLIIFASFSSSFLKGFKFVVLCFLFFIHTRIFF